MARILISSPNAQLPVGAQFERLSSALAAAGHEVLFLTFRDRVNPSGDERSSANLRYLRWPSFEPTHLVDAKFLASELRSFRPDCVIGQMSSVNWTMTLGLAMRVPIRVAWYHFVVRAGLMDAGQDKLRLTARRRAIAYHCATRIVSVSEAATEELRTFYGIPRRRCVVVHNGLDDPGRTARPAGGSRLRLVTVGRLVRSKGHAELIEALVASGDVELVVVGDGPERQRLDDLTRRLGLDSAVSFRGDLPHPEAMDVLASADVYVHPSLLDNLPGAIIEAMSLGLPVIATRVGGVPEMVADGTEALLVPANDVSAMTAAISSLRSDASRRNLLGERARERFEAHFSMMRFIDRASAVIEDELDRRDR